jgi:fatty-acyl-CoA synthase
LAKRSPVIILENMVVPSSLGALLDCAPPGSPAVAAGARTITYGMLAEESRRVAGALASLGIGPGDRVGLWLPNVPEWLVLCFALARLGAIGVAINTRFRSTELGDIVRRTGCRALALEPSFGRVNFAEILAGVDHASLDRLETLILCSEGHLPTGKRQIDYAALAGHARLEQERGGLESGTAIFTTSGTTNAPKFVLHSQRSLWAHAQDVVRGFGLSGAVVLQSLPLCGVFGFCQAMAGFAAQGCVVLQAAWDAEEAAALVEKHRVSVFNGTDAMIAALLDATSEAALCRIPFSGYAAFDPALADVVERAARRGLTLVGLYGMSEVQAFFARRHESEPLEWRPVPGGTPVSRDAQVRTRDPDSGRLLSRGESGELELRGPSLMQGYFGDPDATAQAMTADGFVRTGDLGRVLDDGSFVFEARMGDVLRLSGFLVAPAEIESHLQHHPSIDGAQVVGVSTAAGVKPIAFVTPKPGALVDEADVKAHCGAGLARYKVPVRVVVIDVFPTTMSANGIKIQKAKLREKARAILSASE